MQCKQFEVGMTTQNHKIMRSSTVELTLTLRGGTRNEANISMDSVEERQPKKRASEPSNDPNDKIISDNMDLLRKDIEAASKRTLEQMEMITKQSHEVMANMLQAQPTKTNNDGNVRFTAIEARIVALERSTRVVATGFIANSREEETDIVETRCARSWNVPQNG